MNNTHEKKVARLAELGFELAENVRVTIWSQKISVRHNCGRKLFAAYYALSSQNTRCPCVTGERASTHEQKVARLAELEYEPINDARIERSSQMITVRHSCGRRLCAEYNHLTTGHTRCDCITGEIAHTHEQKIVRLANSGWSLENEIVRIEKNTQKITVRHICGKVRTAEYQHLVSGNTRCECITGERADTHEKKIARLANCGWDLENKTVRIEGAFQKICARHSCGKIREATYDNFVSGNTRCECMGRKPPPQGETFLYLWKVFEDGEESFLKLGLTHDLQKRVDRYFRADRNDFSRYSFQLIALTQFETRSAGHAGETDVKNYYVKEYGLCDKSLALIDWDNGKSEICSLAALDEIVADSIWDEFPENEFYSPTMKEF